MWYNEIKRKGRDFMEASRKGLERIRPALDRFVQQLLPIYGVALKRVMVFGSYARGEERDTSDVDVLLLLDMTEDEIRAKQHELSRLLFLLDGSDPWLDIQPVTIPLRRFEGWKQVHPFYQNIAQEGISIYEAA